MANIKFKRGLQANLPSVVEDGVFYLTTDTNRLYVGNGSTRKLLNQTVNIVSDLTTLETESNAWITNGTVNQKWRLSKGELPEGLNCEAVVDINLALDIEKNGYTGINVVSEDEVYE